jgi:hypothetical protein
LVAVGTPAAPFATENPGETMTSCWLRSLVLLSLVVLLGVADSAEAQKKKKKGLGNTTWVGRETLPGYGPLTFKFSAVDTVTMIDAKSTSRGRYSLDGMDVRLTFANGEVVYTGKVNDATMSGNARNAKLDWTWEVTRKKKGKG